MSANSGRTSSAALLQLQHDAFVSHASEKAAWCGQLTVKFQARVDGV